MVNIYENLRDETGNFIPGRTKLFVHKVGDNGEVLEFTNGLAFVPETTGSMFIVDEYVVHQIDRLQLSAGQLTEKDGMTVQKPIKTADELRMEELEREMTALKSKQGIQPSE